MKNKTCYLAGKVTPVRFPKKLLFLWWWYVTLKFKTYELFLTLMGYDVINPLNHIPKDSTWEQAMSICLHSLLPQSEYIFMQFDWRWSNGAKRELREAARTDVKLLNDGFTVQRYYWTYYLKNLNFTER